MGTEDVPRPHRSQQPSARWGLSWSELGVALTLEETVHECEWITDTGPSLCSLVLPRERPPPRKGHVRAKPRSREWILGVPHSETDGRVLSSQSPPPHRPESVAPAPCRVRSPHPARLDSRKERGVQHLSGSCVGTSGGRQVGRAEVEATCSSKLLMRGFWWARGWLVG